MNAAPSQSRHPGCPACHSAFRIPHSAFHGGATSTIIILCLVVLAGILFVTRVMQEKNEEQNAAVIQQSRLDPQSCLERFFIERSLRRDDYRIKEWRALLDFMSLEDRAWFERNYVFLAALNPRYGGPSAKNAPAEEKQFAALLELLAFEPRKVRPVIVRIQTSESHGVAYIHQPGQFQTLHPIFLVREGEEWKIRRFLGARDSPRYLTGLIEEKKRQGAALEEEEQRYLAKPQRWAADKQAQMLRESGISPEPPK